MRPHELAKFPPTTRGARLLGTYIPKRAPITGNSLICCWRLQGYWKTCSRFPPPVLFAQFVRFLVGPCSSLANCIRSGPFKDGPSNLRQALSVQRPVCRRVAYRACFGCCSHCPPGAHNVLLASFAAQGMTMRARLWQPQPQARTVGFAAGHKARIASHL